MINIKDRYIFTHIEKTAGSSMAFELQKNHLGHLYCISTNFAQNRSSKDSPMQVGFALLGDIKDSYPNKHANLATFKSIFQSPDWHLVSEYGWDQFFKFAFVRHPLYRYVSLYLHQLKSLIELTYRFCTVKICPEKAHELGGDLKIEVNETWIQNCKDRGMQSPTGGPGLYSFTFDWFVKSYIHSGYRSQLTQIIDADDNMLTDFIGKFENLEDDWKKVCEKLQIAPHLPKKKMTGGTKELYGQFYTDDLKEFIYDRDKEDFERLGYEKI